MPSHTDPETIDTFYVLDFDHCLGNTNKLQAALRHVIERETGISPDTIKRARQEYQQNGGSFDTASYVMRLFDDIGEDGRAKWQMLESQFVEESQSENMLEPFAAQLLRLLREAHAHFGIVTYGGATWQRAKLAASGLLATPHLVTHVKEKGHLLSSWRRSDGRFAIPDVLGGGTAYIATSLVFIDDNPTSFVGIPSGITAICALSPDKVVTAEALAALPSSVQVTHGIHEATKLLFSR